MKNKILILLLIICFEGKGKKSYSRYKIKYDICEENCKLIHSSSYKLCVLNCIDKSCFIQLFHNNLKNNGEIYYDLEEWFKECFNKNLINF